jgi:hypothetical protein
MMCETFWQFLFMGEGILSLGDTLFGPYVTVGMFLGVMALCPFLVLLAIITMSLIIHLLLTVVRGGGNGFEATFRVVAMAQAAQIWRVIPFFGGFIGIFWFLAVQIIGLKEIHETSYFRVALAFIAPLVIVLLVLVAVQT